MRPPGQLAGDGECHASMLVFRGLKVNRGRPPLENQLRLLAVHAHPDDESSKGAATMAKYVREGARVLVVSCTGGERGSVPNPAMERPGILERLPAVRIEERTAAAAILGVEHQWLGFVD